MLSTNHADSVARAVCLLTTTFPRLLDNGVVQADQAFVPESILTIGAWAMLCLRVSTPSESVLRLQCSKSELSAIAGCLLVGCYMPACWYRYDVRCFAESI